MIRKCEKRDFRAILSIINEAASVYKGAIPPDCWKEPYMPEEELRHEIRSGVEFWGYEKNGELEGVMGLQPLGDVTLIRHAYVRIQSQNQGVGGKLLAALCGKSNRPVLVGTWAAAVWAIRFYEKHGFRMVTLDEKDRLLKKYWTISPRQIETSVVLAAPGWFKK